MLDLAVQEEVEPDQPEALALLYQMRRLDMPIVEGGLWYQPWIFVQELNTCIDAESEHEQRLAKNLEFKLQQQQNQQQDNPPHGDGSLAV